MLKQYLSIKNRLQNEEGQGLVEYALILVLVSIAVIALLAVLGDEINVVFNDIQSALKD